MDASAEAAIGTGDDVLAAHHPCEGQDAVGDELGVLDDVGGVADDTRDQGLAVGRFDDFEGAWPRNWDKAQLNDYL